MHSAHLACAICRPGPTGSAALLRTEALVVRMPCLGLRIGNITLQRHANCTDVTWCVFKRRQALRAYPRHGRKVCSANPDARDSSRSNIASKERRTDELASRQTDSPPPDDATAIDTLSLLAVSGLWSTYSPALRYLYMLPGPPAPAALTASRALLQAACLLPPLLLSQGLQNQHVSKPGSAQQARDTETTSCMRSSSQSA